MPPLLLLKGILDTVKGLWERRHEVVLGLLAVALLLLYTAGVKIHALKAALAARPEVDAASESHTFKGPTLTKEKVRRFTRPPAPGEPKDCPAVNVEEVERETLEGAQESHASSSRHEKPVGPEPAAKTLYAGVALGPLAYQKPRFSAGVTLADRLDLGGYWDSRRALNDGAVGVETRLRFRWPF